MANAAMDPRQQRNQRRRFRLTGRRQRTPIEIRYRLRQGGQTRPPSGSANSTSTPIGSGGMPGSSTPVGGSGLPASSTGQPGMAAPGDSVYDTPGNQPQDNFGAPRPGSGEEDDSANGPGGSGAGPAVSPRARRGRGGQRGRRGILPGAGRGGLASSPYGAYDDSADEEPPEPSDEEAGEGEQPGLAPSDDAGPVYDEPGNAPSEPGPSQGDGPDDSQPDGSKAENNDQPSRSKKTSSEEDRQNLADQEASADSFFDKGSHENKVGRGYRKNADKPGFLKRQLGKHNRLYLMGGSAAILIGLSLLIFVLLAPFKILHIINNLQSRFYATSENAVQRETDVLFSSYVKKYVLPAARKCHGEVSKSCNPITGGDLVSQLFKGWRNARLEEKLASNYGLEFKYSHGSYWIKTPGMSGDGVSLGGENDPKGFVNSGGTLDEFLSKSDDPQFKRVSRTQLRQMYKDAISNETKWKQVMYRFKAGTLLAKKYGLKRCIIACTARDNFADWKDNKTKAAKLVFVQRVIAPRAQMIGVVLSCLYSGCDSKTTSDGKTVTAFDKQAQQVLDNAAARYGVDSVADMVKVANDINKRGYQKYILDKAVSALIGASSSDAGDKAAKEAAQEAAKEVSDKVLPVVGWVTFASKIVEMGQRIGPEIRHYAYVTNAAAMVNTYMIYRTFADEMKTGHVDPAIVGSFTDSLGPGSKTSGGGPASAEDTPIYQSLIDGGSSSSSLALGNLLGGNAYASSNSPNYICDDGKPVPAGNVVCSEYNLNNGGNKYADAISGFINSSEMFPVRILAKYVNKVSGWLNWAIGKITSIIVNIPPFSTLGQVITSAASPVIKTVAQHVVPNVTSNNPGGGMNFALAAGGADVSGNDYAHEGLGASTLSPKQLSAILDEQNQQELQDYRSKSFFARLFDTSSNYSLASRLIMRTPGNFSSAGQSIANLFSSPFGKLGNLFAALFNPGRALAAGNQSDPYGVTQYGYALDDQNFAAASQDPEAFWKQNCSTDGTTIDWSTQFNQNWQSNAKINDNTGEYDNSASNPCLLIQATVGSAGAMFDTSLLTPDDVNGSSSASGVGNNGPSGTGGYQDPFRDIEKNGSLVPKRVDQGVDYGGAGPVYAIGNGKLVNIHNSGWAVLGGPDTFMVYQLSDGPAAGKYVFVAENCIPTPSLKVGDAVNSSTALCTMIDASPHIETGWADGNALGAAMAHDVWGNAVDNEQHYTAYGLNFSQLLQKLGAPAGTIVPGAQMLGNLQSGWPTW